MCFHQVEASTSLTILTPNRRHNTSENKKYFFEIKMVSKDGVSAKVQKQEFCDSVCYKIPYLTDSCELSILHDSVTVCVAKFL